MCWRLSHRDSSNRSRPAFHFHIGAGSASVGLSLPPPIFRAGTIFLSCALSHSSQSGHHEPGCSVAVLSQLSTLELLGFLPVQYWYLGLLGGLITPAMWPDPARTYFTGPPKNCEPYSTDLAGAMWSSRVARL